MTSYGFPSSGNADEDEAIAAGIIQRGRRLASGICPNGCGYLEGGPVSESATCPKCSFTGYGERYGEIARENAE